MSVEVLRDDLILSTELIMKTVNRKDFVKLTFPTLALRRAIVQRERAKQREYNQSILKLFTKFICFLKIILNQITKHLLEK